MSYGDIAPPTGVREMLNDFPKKSSLDNIVQISMCLNHQ